MANFCTVTVLSVAPKSVDGCTRTFTTINKAIVWVSDNYKIFVLRCSTCIKFTGDRSKATGIGEGYHWKSLAGYLHRCDRWVMAVLYKHEQLCSPCPPSVTKQPYLGTALLSPHRGGGDKRSPKHCLLTYSP